MNPQPTIYGTDDDKPEALTDALAIARANLDMSNALLADARKQIAALTASNRALARQPRTLLLCLEAETRVLTDAMETLRRSARDHNELFAVRDIDDALTRLRAWVDTPANGAK